MKIAENYRTWFKETGDATSAALLTLAETLAAGNDAPRDRLLTAKEAGERLAVCRTTIHELVTSGKLPAARIGAGRGAIRIRPDDLATFEREAVTAGKSQVSENEPVTLDLLRQLAKPRSGRQRRGA